MDQDITTPNTKTQLFPTSGGVTITREQIIPGAVYLTEEAARLIRVEVSTIQRFVRTGQIRGKGRPFRILGSELLKLV